MINVSAFPLCAGRLHFQRAQLTDPAMNEYWAAVCVADDFADDKLATFGGFDFSDISPENGIRQLERLEKFIGSRKASTGTGMLDAENSVRSFLGANGVKVSRLDGLEDYWMAANTLWPAVSTTGLKVKDIFALRFQISNLPKKKRSKQARANLSRLPANWSASTPPVQVAAQ